MLGREIMIIGLSHVVQVIRIIGADNCDDSYDD